MAKKRLNKKVALIGSAIFVVFVIMLIAAVLYLSQDPEKFMKDGDIAVQAADEATDELIKEQEYRKAISSYNKARSQAKVDSLKIETISRLADVHTKTDEWNYVLGSWNGIIQIDPRHAETRYRRLKYFYIMASNGAQGYWRDIEQQASEFLEFTDAELLAEDIAQWQFFGMPQEPIAERLGPYL